METTNQPISSSSPSSGDDDPPPADDVTFRFNQKLTLISELDANDDSNPQQLIPEASETDDGPISSSPPAADDVTFPFNQLQINGNNYDSKISNPQNLIPEASETEEDDDDEEDEEEDDGDFTFMCVDDNDNGNGSLTAFENGQIRNVFPLFDQSLLLTGDYDDGNRRFPIDVPVDKVFIESPRRSPSDNGKTDGSIRRLPIEVPVDNVFIESPRRSSSDNGETDGTGTVRRLQNESEINKSNSTGFSKLWRFRNNEMNRSNSDGRDAFVFLESSDTGTTATTSDGKPNGVKVNVGKGKGVKKAKKSTASAHEVYLKQKGGQTEEERRRSYLPYRPGLMGFFTNVNGGLSKNVHPF
ncbi:hypothetical protein HanRHA438_Chr12g0574651 [Helianthus annuus]|nr:hypothetical protein HanHA89_Chr12g0487631 [Helianthus annuus]KAJ0868443.1 hypothetical protein HanRHA438_Chr12g0574651 [Helianthus annuus]